MPLRIEQIAGEARFGVLATAMIAGAVMASVSGIVFGWLSDLSLERGGGRRSWIAAGLVATIVSYLGIASARTPEMLVVAVMEFQVSLNIALAPLVALLAEESLDRQKGLLSGLLAGAQPLGAVMGPLLAAWTTPALGLRLGVIAMVSVVCLVPLLATSARPTAPAVDRRMVVSPRDMAIAWISRLMVQIAGNVLFAYLFVLHGAIRSARRARWRAGAGGRPDLHGEPRTPAPGPCVWPLVGQVRPAQTVPHGRRRARRRGSRRDGGRVRLDRRRDRLLPVFERLDHLSDATDRFRHAIAPQSAAAGARSGADQSVEYGAGADRAGIGVVAGDPAQFRDVVLRACRFVVARRIGDAWRDGTEIARLGPATAAS
ncbi:hypothetical protein ACVWYO_001596 [Sphingomonas sp. UYP23]